MSKRKKELKKAKKQLKKQEKEAEKKKKQITRKYRTQNAIKWLDRLPPADFGIIAITGILIIFGIIMIFSASYYYSMSEFGNPYSYLFKATVWGIIGAFLMAFFSIINYNIYLKWHFPILIVSIVLLVLLFTPLGSEVNGATRWLNLKVMTLMPGELAKPAAIIFTSGFLVKHKRNINDLQKTIAPLVAVAGIFGILIMLQPNMSTAVTVVLIIFAIMFVSGIKMGYFIALILAGIAGGIAIILVGGGYRLQRVLSFLDPFADPQGDSYQVVQSLLALGSGGIFGKGLGNSIQKTLYLPEPQNDFIMAIIGEELGLVGILVLVILFSLLIWRGIKVGLRAPNQFGFFIATGVMMLIGIQFAMNLAIITSSIPPTGVALPFISYGGNSMMIFSSLIGIVLNISRQANKAENIRKTKITDRVRKNRVYFSKDRSKK